MVREALGYSVITVSNEVVFRLQYKSGKDRSVILAAVLRMILNLYSEYHGANYHTCKHCWEWKQGCTRQVKANHRDFECGRCMTFAYAGDGETILKSDWMGKGPYQYEATAYREYKYWKKRGFTRDYARHLENKVSPRIIFGKPSKLSANTINGKSEGKSKAIIAADDDGCMGLEKAKSQCDEFKWDPEGGTTIILCAVRSMCTSKCLQARQKRMRNISRNARNGRRSLSPRWP